MKPRVIKDTTDRSQHDDVLIAFDGISIVDSTKVLCPLFDETEIFNFFHSAIARSFSHLWTKCGILICYRNKEK